VTLDNWVGRNHVHSAHTRGGSNLHEQSDVTFFTPVRTPGVSDEPVRIGWISIDVISNDGNTVVKGSSAGRLIEDTGDVGIPIIISLNGNRVDSEGSRVDKLHLLLWGDIDEVGDGSSSLAGEALVAETIGGFVWIVALSGDSLGHDVLEGLVHESSLASVVSIESGTIDKLLLREAGESVSLLSPSSFNSSNGGKGPAGSTLTLILDWADDILLDPVDIVRWIALCKRGLGHVVSDFVLGNFVTKELSTELLIGQVGELVDAKSVSEVLTVDKIDALELLGENTESEFALLWSV
jgi:hypothetical protein